MRARHIASLVPTFALLAGACTDDSRPGDSAGQVTASGATEATTEPAGTTGDAPTTTVDPQTASGTGTSGQDPTDTSPPTTGDATTDPTGATSGDTTGGGGDPVPGALCGEIPACDATPPTIPGQGPEESELSRGRDMFYVDGEDQWVIAKFTKWGFPADKDIEGSTVHLFLDRGCEGTWEDLGIAITTAEGEHPTVEGVEDTGGRVYYKIGPSKKLGPGRHRVHMVVEEYWNTADAIIDVVPKGTPFFVSDVDGTLTTSENAEAWDFLLGTMPDANPYAAEAQSILASKGYRAFYITARPEWLDRRTRDFVKLRGFPAGLVHTTTTYGGATGGPAAAYKTGEFAMLKAKGLVPAFLFGNKDSDAEAFDTTMIPTDHRFFFQFTDAVYGGTRIDSYQELLAPFMALPDLCNP